MASRGPRPHRLALAVLVPVLAGAGLVAGGLGAAGLVAAGLRGRFGLVGGGSLAGGLVRLVAVLVLVIIAGIVRVALARQRGLGSLGGLGGLGFRILAIALGAGLGDLGLLALDLDL